MQQSDTEMTTTFLLLRSITLERPSVRNTELPAGEAFNLALRAMASRVGFMTQWFGWQHSAVATSAQPGTLVWIINWTDTASAKALCIPEDLRTTLGALIEFFGTPLSTPPDHNLTAAQRNSLILVTEWNCGYVLKILNWTNRTLMLDVRKSPSSDHKQVHFTANGGSEDEWRAYGKVVAPNPEKDEWNQATVMIQSLHRQVNEQELPYEDPTFDEAVQIPNSAVVVTLTRTRWCTSIRKDLMATISARRVD